METLNLTQLAQDVFDGKEDPIKAYGIAKTYLDNAKEALEAIYEAAINEAHKYPENTFQHEGFQITKKEGSKRFDFKHLTEWKEAKANLTEVEKKFKAAYNAYQTNLTSVTDEGEVIELPKMVVGKDSLSIKKIDESIGG